MEYAILALTCGVVLAMAARLLRRRAGGPEGLLRELAQRWPGRSRGYPVAASADVDAATLTIRVQVPTPRVTLSAEGLRGRLMGAHKPTDIHTGIEAFDRRVVIEGGPVDAALSVLGAEARELLAATLERWPTMRVADGGVCVAIPDTTRIQRAEQALDDLVSLARILDTGETTVAQRLSRHVATDPEPAFRHRCLDLLLAHHRGDPFTRQALDVAVSAPDPRLRIKAAAALGGEAGLAKLRTITDDPCSNPRLRAESARALIGAFGPESRAIKHVRRLLSQDLPDAVTLAILQALGSKGIQLPPSELRAHCRSADPLIRSAAATQLGLRAGDARGEVWLLALLEDEVAAVRIAAADGLARVGSRRAIPLLIGKLGGFITGGEFRDAARDAINAIQARQGRGGTGKLSLAEGTAGELSVVGEDAGELSLADDTD